MFLLGDDVDVQDSNFQVDQDDSGMYFVRN